MLYQDLPARLFLLNTPAAISPTASAVMGDVVDAVRHKASPRGIGWTDAPLTLGDPEAIPSRWYIRSGESWSVTEAMTADKLPASQVRYRVLD